jgi:predicted Ser/Thr protein kinase
MTLTGRLLLPTDVVLTPVADLREEMRRRLFSEPGGEPGDWTITSARLRSPSRLLDSESAALLAEFREPVTVVEAVLRFSRARGSDPENALVAAFPVIERLFRAGFLVADSAGGVNLPALAPGDEVDGWAVEECLRHLEDTELYRVRREGRTAALKIERPGASRPDFAREAAALAYLAEKGERCAPGLLGAGTFSGRRYLIAEWCPGVDAATAARELRGDRRGLFRLGGSILEAYRRLHHSGMVQGDVHPHNLLVAGDGTVRLVDFGAAVWCGEAAHLPPLRRMGVGLFYEPEYAQALRTGGAPPGPTPLGEQYALAALLAGLLAGEPYLDFSLVAEEMLRQICEQAPRSWSRPWPEVEALLGRALSKAPSERFGSVAALAAAWKTLAEPPPAPSRKADAGEAFLAAWLERVAPEGPLWRQPLSASIAAGAAGISLALYRVALAHDDGERLAWADLWALRAARHPGLGDEESSAPSLYHSAVGIACVQALLAHALADSKGLRSAWQEILSSLVRSPDQPVDLTLGPTGLLLAAAILAETVPGDLRADWLEKGGTLARLPSPPVNLGIAHGEGGLLYAGLAWSRAAGTAPPPELVARLERLAAAAHPWGRGLRWPWRDGAREVGTMPGWCNGSAGLMHLWALAHRVLAEPRWLRLAESAAWNAWEDPAGGGSLCCGLAGRAYALLRWYQESGEEVWLERARALAARAVAVTSKIGIESRDSLHRGETGVAVLLADLARPAEAAFPFFAEMG